MKVRLVFPSGWSTGLTALIGLSTVALAGPDGSDNAAMCVLNTQMLPENEVRTTPNTSVASGHTQVKVRNDGTIEFKTFLLNPADEVFTRGPHPRPSGNERERRHRGRLPRGGKSRSRR